MSLREHLLAEIERREKTARKAIAGPWGRDDTGQIFAMRPTTMITVHVAEADGNTDAEFIALHDPADALRRYAAARRVLERHRPTTIGGAPLMAGDECACYAPWPCAEILDLADSLGISSEEGTQP